MNRNAAIAVLVVATLLLAVGFLLLCAAAREPSRLLLAVALLIVGGGLAAWSGRALRRSRELDPEHLSDRITALARAGGHAEVTLSQVVAELRVPDEAALEALSLLQSKGQCQREHRGGSDFYVFQGLKTLKVARRCGFCGSTFSVRTPLEKCPNCGGDLEITRQ